MAEDDSEVAPQGGPGAPSDHHMLADLWHEHKTPIMIVIAGATMLLTAILVFRNQSSTGSSTAAPGTPTAGGVPTVQTTDSTNAYNSLTGYMQAILQQLQQMGQGSTPSSPPSNPSPPGGVVNTPPLQGGHPPMGNGGNPVSTAPVAPIRAPIPAASAPTPSAPAGAASQYVTVGTWTPNPAWNTTLSGIAQHEGVTLTRIEQLNPQISNPNLIYPNERVKVS